MIYTSGVLDSLFCPTKGGVGIESRLAFIKKNKKKKENPEIQSL